MNTWNTASVGTVSTPITEDALRRAWEAARDQPIGPRIHIVSRATYDAWRRYYAWRAYVRYVTARP